MKLLIFSAFAGIVSLSLITGIALAKEDPKAIVDKGVEAMKVAGVEAVSVLTIVDAKGRERVRKIAQVSKLYDNGKTEKRLVRFLSPADVKGTGLLSYDYENKDDDMWLFMPALRKTRRIVSSEKAKNFMGSEFSYADMTPPDVKDFKFKMLGTEKVKELECWKIEVTPKTDDIAEENGFSKRIMTIAKKDYIIRKAAYYDLDGSLHKELEVLALEEIDKKNHKYRLTNLIMINKQNNRRSIMKIEKLAYSPNVKDEYFTTRYLERP